MTAMLINQTATEDGRAVYNFESRGTSYTVIPQKCGELFDIFSERKSASFGTQIKVMTLKEMKERSKALNNLAALIAA